MWPKFIPDLANTIMSQQFTKPGGAIIAYKPPVQVSEIGNPLNAALKSNQADYINAYNPAPLSGRYDFGVAVAEHYIEAVKGKAQTHVAEFHTNNGAAELLLKQGYGFAFERLLKEGDIPLMDQYDEDGNLTEMGKESHPAYADFCPEVKEPTAEDLAKIEAENTKAFNKFASAENASEYNLHKFKFYQFPCLVGTESQKELEVIFATRILMGYEFMSTGDQRWDYFVWACHLGNANYVLGLYPNINNKARSGISDAGYDWKELADNVSLYVKTAILDAHPAQDQTGAGSWGSGFQTGRNSRTKARIKRPAENAIKYPTLQNDSGEDITPDYCPINRYKIQVAYDFEHNPPDNPSKRPKILTSNVVACFTYYPGKRTGGQPYLQNEQKVLFNKTTYQVKYEKSSNWVKNKYEKDEWEKKWRKTPPKGRLNSAARADDSTAAFLALGWDGSAWNGNEAGTQYKFEYHKVICAIAAAEKCEEEMTAVDHPWLPGANGYAGDPYMMMARVTIAYWYACIIKPFKPTPSAPPALISPPLTGIYIPIYYGSANRLANNLRRAWNTGKTFNKVPVLQPPAFAVSTAVAGAYALHLLEFKLLYLGGIPTPAGPVPMVGFVPIVF